MCLFIFFSIFLVEVDSGQMAAWEVEIRWLSDFWVISLWWTEHSHNFNLTITITMTWVMLRHNAKYVSLILYCLIPPLRAGKELGRNSQSCPPRNAFAIPWPLPECRPETHRRRWRSRTEGFWRKQICDISIAWSRIEDRGSECHYALDTALKLSFMKRLYALYFFVRHAA